jgi:hypothetical protein
MTSLSQQLAKASRSPYVVGSALGVLNTFAFATAKRGLGVTTAFESVAALAGRRIAPDAMRVNAYVRKREETPKIDWETFLVVGLLGGSYLAARATGERTSRVVPKLWERRFGRSRGKRYVTAFMGGAVMMFGARMAKGCTSGHGITGTMQLALSSWVFTPLMFASAAVFARALHRKGGR